MFDRSMLESTTTLLHILPTPSSICRLIIQTRITPHFTGSKKHSEERTERPGNVQVLLRLTGAQLRLRFEDGMAMAI